MGGHMGTMRTMYKNIFDQRPKHIASHKRIQLTILFTNRIGKPTLKDSQQKKKKKTLNKQKTLNSDLYKMYKQQQTRLF